MKKLPVLAYLLPTLFFFSESNADFVVIGGAGQNIISSDAPNYPIANSFSIGQNFAPSIQMPTPSQGSINDVAINSFTGDVIFVGEDELNSGLLAYRGSVLLPSVEVVSFSPNVTQGVFSSVAFDSNGNAILAGQDSLNDVPIAYRLPAGSNIATPISFPGSPDGAIYSVAIGSDNVAILAGVDDIALKPLIYKIQPGATTANAVSVPDTSLTGYLQAVAIDSNNVALLGGSDGTNSQALIYRLNVGSFSASAITIPGSGDGGTVYSIAFAPDNSAILGGFTNTEPLIYRILQGGTSASAIANVNSNDGSFSSVAIDSNGIAILAGADSTTNSPLISKVAPGASQATSVTIPTTTEGSLFSVAIGAENIAVLAGSTGDNNPIIYTFSTSENAAATLSFSLSFNDGLFRKVAIYPCDGTYDIRRLRPYYNLQLNETKTLLRQAGLL